MINFETLPTGSKLRIQFSDGFVAHATYSHLALDYVYGHFDDLPTEECTILEICGHVQFEFELIRLKLLNPN